MRVIARSSIVESRAVGRVLIWHTLRRDHSPILRLHVLATSERQPDEEK